MPNLSGLEFGRPVFQSSCNNMMKENNLMTTWSGLYHYFILQISLAKQHLDAEVEWYAQIRKFGDF